MPRNFCLSLAVPLSPSLCLGGAGTWSVSLSLTQLFRSHEQGAKPRIFKPNTTVERIRNNLSLAEMR